MTKYTFLLIAIFCSSICFGQKHGAYFASKPDSFVLGLVEHLPSEVLGETRTLNIYLPDGYAKDTKALYPVIYLLDGSANEDFIHIVGLVQFLTMIGSMPETIVVGIGNVDRRRDFTYPTTIAKDKELYPTTGGSAKFISFIEHDLQPFINARYRTNGVTTIIGQSLGGLLATEVLLRKPALFTNYLIVSPSLWWDNESLLNLAPTLLKNLPNKEMRIYISVGTEGKQMEDDALRLTNMLKGLGNDKLHITFMPLPDETHLTILHNSAYKGLIDLNVDKKK